MTIDNIVVLQPKVMLDQILGTSVNKGKKLLEYCLRRQESVQYYFPHKNQLDFY